MKRINKKIKMYEEIFAKNRQRTTQTKTTTNKNPMFYNHRKNRETENDIHRHGFMITEKSSKSPYHLKINISIYANCQLSKVRRGANFLLRGPRLYLYTLRAPTIPMAPTIPERMMSEHIILTRYLYQ